MRPVSVVSVTRLGANTFWEASYLGRSLLRIPEALRPNISIAFDNSGAAARGLSEIYNAVIESTADDVDLVFIHDDVYINDWFFSHRVSEALDHFDLVGVAGSVNPDLAQPSWGLCFDRELRSLGWQPGLVRSGVVNHFDYGCPNLSVYGPVPMECHLLDGAFMALRTSVIKREGLRFDPQFRFHCYDLDFCRTATSKGLRLGTWPIALTHNSGGAFDAEQFKHAARQYLGKWPSPHGTANENVHSLSGSCVSVRWNAS